MFLVEISPALGIVTSILTQILKIIPWFDTKAKKQWLAFVISLIVVAATAYEEGQYFLVEPIELISAIGATLATAYAVYKGTKHIRERTK